jgi:sugar lactone lactonase YvrE
MRKVVEDKGRLYEGPIWINDALYFVDILKGEIHELRDGKHMVLARFNTYVSSIQPSKNGYLIATAGKGFYKVSYNGEVKLVYEVRDWDNRNRFNDGKCDQLGRYWVGTMNLEEKYPTGSLFVFDGINIKRVLEGVTISNGIAWSLDNKKMYYIDSPTRKVFVFDFDLEKGEINNRNVLVDLSRYNGVPDGMTIDSEGYLWVAIYGGGRVLRISPEGRIVEELLVPTSHTTSATFGGSNLKTLYITTADDEVNGGYVYAEDLDVRGVETNLCSF